MTKCGPGDSSSRSGRVSAPRPPPVRDDHAGKRNDLVGKPRLREARRLARSSRDPAYPPIWSPKANGRGYGGGWKDSNAGGTATTWPPLEKML